MAVPGADRRTATDGRETGGSDTMAFGRRELDGALPTAGSDMPAKTDEAGSVLVSVTADNSDRRDVQVPRDMVITK